MNHFKKYFSILINLFLFSCVWELSKLITVKTLEAEKVKDISATCSGNVTNDGGSPISERGICYDVHQGPTTNNRKVECGSGTGAFSAELTGLNPGTKYYYRAYASNKTGTIYGNEKTFITTSNVIVTTNQVIQITSFSISVSGNIINNSGLPVTERGFCYDTSPEPELSDHKQISGSGDGNFNSNISGLEPGILYYLRAYALNSSGISYGNEVSFRTAPPSFPVVNTSSVTAITNNSAISSGNVTNEGGTPVTARGICYSTSPNPTISNNHVSGGSGPGTFTVNLTGLNQGTTYYIKAYATNQSGTSYGTQLNFTTSVYEIPALSTLSVTSVTASTAVSGGNITSDGGKAVTSRGICYSTSSNPTTSDQKVISGSGTGNFTINLNSLAPGTTYHLRAFATNDVGTAYGNEVIFTTATLLVPVVITSQPSSITNTAAITGGNVISDGGSEVTARGICYSTSPNPTLSDSKISNGSGLGSFTISLSELSLGTIYYVRAYATNIIGTAYGDVISFKTSSVLTIGLKYQGGIIFYLDESGSHGLIAALSDLSAAARWGCSGISIENSREESIGSGLANTIAIISECSSSGIAARLCYNAVIAGFDDWYLPSKDELNMMYVNLKSKNTGGFSDSDYWSSSQESGKNAWLQSFGNGRSSDKNKNSEERVRAIRSF